MYKDDTGIEAYPGYNEAAEISYGRKMEVRGAIQIGVRADASSFPEIPQTSSSEATITPIRTPETLSNLTPDELHIEQIRRQIEELGRAA